MKPTENEMVSSRRKSHCKRVRQVSVCVVHECVGVYVCGTCVCVCVLNIVDQHFNRLLYILECDPQNLC